MSTGAEAPELGRLEAEIERVTAEMFTLLGAGDPHGAAEALDELRDLAWQRRAAGLRGRRQRGPRVPAREGAGA